MKNTSNIIHNTLEKPKLSIIVPVYNVEAYLCKCVDSLLAQDYDDYEIILVDDGSTDKSGAICDEYASPSFVHSLTRSVVIKVLHQANAGLSAARNSGIRIANGEYLCFVDSDDYWEPNVLGALMEQVERERLDILHFDYQNVRINSTGLCEVFQPYKYPHPVDGRTDVSLGENYLNERMGYGCYACHFVIKREVATTFTPSIHFEDTEWLPRMMLAAKRVNTTTQIVYNYLWREGSITQVQGNIDKMRKNIEDMMTIISRYNDYRAQYPTCAWLRNMQSSMVVSVIANVSQYLYADREDYIKRLKALNVFPLTLANQGRTYLRKARLINISLRLTVELLHLKNRT